MSVRDLIAYAKVDGPPDDWLGLVIVDLQSGAMVDDVIEVDASAGWLVRHARNAAGELYVDGNEVAIERVEGRFAICRPARPAAGAPQGVG